MRHDPPQMHSRTIAGKNLSGIVVEDEFWGEWYFKVPTERGRIWCMRKVDERLG